MNRIPSRVLVILVGLVILAVVATAGAVVDRIVGLRPLDRFLGQRTNLIGEERRILNEESVVIDVAESVSPSVVTVTRQTEARRILEFNPFGGFSSRVEGGQDRDIGTGFIVSEDGLIITNKHVVSNTQVTYKVVTSDNKEYEVQSIARDPSNDIAVLKIDASGLKPVQLGESDNLKVGQFVVAIGTALGEFRHTVTTGVISGLGRGIVAGSVYEGFVERLDGVIQTDAAINPGNSGGPLLNSAGQVIGVNVAVASGAQNIGFAIPIEVVKNALDQYGEMGGVFRRAYLGVEYQVISAQAAILNEVPQGAYITNVLSGSPAEKAGLRTDDIVTRMDGQNVTQSTNGLVDIISKKRVGDRVDMEIWRNEQTFQISATLEEFRE